MAGPLDFFSINSAVRGWLDLCFASLKKAKFEEIERSEPEGITGLGGYTLPSNLVEIFNRFHGKECEGREFQGYLSRKAQLEGYQECQLDPEIVEGKAVKLKLILQA